MMTLLNIIPVHEEGQGGRMIDPERRRLLLELVLQSLWIELVRTLTEDPTSEQLDFMARIQN